MISGARRGELDREVAGRPVLEVTRVRKDFGGVVALHDVSLSVAEGEFVGLIGPNGAGKSTLFNAITGIVVPDGGAISIQGTETTRKSPEEIATLGVGRTFQTPRGFASMTVLENLMVVPHSRGESLLGAFRPRSGWRRDVIKRADGVLEQLGLRDVRNVAYSELTLGHARLLEIGRHMMRDIRMLMLDEPTAGVIPRMQEDLHGVLRRLNDDGVSIVVVEHNLGFVFPLVSKVFVLHKGAVIASGEPAQVQRDPAVITAYLGSAHS